MFQMYFFCILYALLGNMCLVTAARHLVNAKPSLSLDFLLHSGRLVEHPPLADSLPKSMLHLNLGRPYP
eukprot:10499767-Ditylum_brightwellii.AAC.1